MTFKLTLTRSKVLFFIFLSLAHLTATSQTVAVTGELKKWHNVTLTFSGPASSETATPNPFLDYRMVVVFTNGSTTLSIPGYFAADGNAANSSSDSGDKWRVHFVPTLVGTWTWQAFFHSGNQIAIDPNLNNGTPVSFHGQTGTLNIGPTDKTGRDLRGKGLLRYVNGHYLKFAETGEYFLKAGADSPENLLNYADFDNSTNTGGFRKTWQPHVSDFQAGDPSWKGNLGRGLIGAVNYLSSKGMNAFSFLTMTTNGDDKDVFPWIANNGGAAPQNDRLRFDCSKLDQWEIVFSHADRKGMFLHVKTQEEANDQLLDGGQLGVERKLYYRELIARFGHHLALTWNLGAAYDAHTALNDPQQLILKSFAQYIRDLDPYGHPIVVRTLNGQQNEVLAPMLGTASQLAGPSIRTNFNQVHQQTLEWRNRSVQANKPWVVTNDEQGDPGTGVTPDGAGNNHASIRRLTLWGNLMAGGAGVEYFFGLNFPNSDLTCQDFRSRNSMWDQTRHALDFFRNFVPFWEMSNQNALVVNLLNANTNYCLAKPGDAYVIYAPSTIPFLDLQNFSDTFDVRWYNPRTGGGLQMGSLPFVVGPGFISIGNPPVGSTGDWVALVKSRNFQPIVQPPVVTISSPTNNFQVPFSQSVQITASATSINGPITQVQFFEGANLLQAFSASPYTANWTPPGPGSYLIRVLATDNQGLVGRDSVTITVLANQPPVLSVVQPINGSTFQYFQTIDLEANASDPDNGLAQVVFFVDNLPIQTFGSGPFSLTWTPVGAGIFTFKAVATDSAGLSAADSVSFQVTPNQPPQVSFIQPVSGDSVFYNQAVALEIAATDPDGVVDSVQLFVNGVFLQTIVTAPYIANWAPAGPGMFTITATATDSSGLSRSDSVRITVLPNQAPMLTFVQPLNGDALFFNQPVAMEVQASDPDGVVDSVQLFINGFFLQTLTASPYTLTWMHGGPGSYTLTAIATDSSGLSTADSVSFTVLLNQAPDLAFLQPLQGASFNFNQTVDISIQASDPDGVVDSVQLFADSMLLTTFTASPYDYTWTPPGPGAYFFAAIATDSVGAASTDTVFINVLPNQAPVVQFIQPQGGSQVTRNQPFLLEANASDPDGNLQAVYFWVNGVLIDSATSAPFTVNWTPTVIGARTLVAVAMDSLGLASADTIRVTVVNNQPPLISWQQPTAGVQVPLLQPVTLLVNASDPDGTVAQVQFFAGGALLFTATQAPYTTTWTPVISGNFSLVAIATDNLGEASSATIAVVVSANLNPIVTITQPATGDTVMENQSITLAATASDPDGTISQVAFFANGAPVQVVTNSPYQTTWTPPAPGAYLLRAEATDNLGAVARDSVTLVVLANQPPLVAITSPVAGASLALNTAFAFTATASDADGLVDSVTFFVNGTRLGASSSPPYSLSYTPTSPGQYTLTATATDDQGATATSSIVVTVANQRPTVTITQPVNNATRPTGLAFNITATASDPDGSVTQVAFFRNNTPIATATTAPYSVSWNPQTPGTYLLIAVATDNFGATAADTITLIVTQNQAPVVAITQPANGATLSINQPVQILATASDPDGIISRVEFYNGNTLLATDATAPYAHTWSPPAAGVYTLRAVAYDNVNNTGEATVTITIAPNQPPVVAITQPAATGTFLAGLPVNITATASDPDGSVVSVTFLVNGAQIGVDAASPYTAIFTPPNAGSYTIQARALDNSGATTTASRTINVAPNHPPVVTFTQPVSPTLSVAVGQQVSLQFTVTDLDNNVTSIVLFRNGTAVQAYIGAGPFSHSWTPATAGVYTYIAAASDAGGNVRSDTVVVTAVTASLPTVRFLNPVNGSTVKTSVSNPIQIQAASSAGSISQVVFRVGNTVVQTFTAPPYVTTWTPPTNGAYNLFAIATDNFGQTRRDSVRVTAVANQPPQVFIWQPATGSSYLLGQTVTISANASDPDGTVANVRFAANGVTLQNFSAPPYSLNWTPASAGAYTLTATATDDNGATSTSTINVTVNVFLPPVVQFTQPLNGQFVSGGKPFVMTANASDPDGTIQRVEFFVGNTLVFTDFTPPYTTTWAPTIVGAYNLIARAWDSQGLSSRDSIRVMVGNFAPPTVKFNNPKNGMSLPANNLVNVSVNATDVDGAVAEVRFFVGNTLVATRTTPPYNFSWTPTAPGAYNLIARARDVQGLWARDSIRVFVQAQAPPSVRFLQPTHQGTVKTNLPNAVQIQAASSGVITQVVFRVGNTVLQTFTAPPYTTTWTPPSNGAYSLVAIATDNLGQTRRDSIRVTAVANQPPLLTLIQPANGASYLLGQTIPIQANASDPDGTVASVSFAINGVTTQTLTAAPYQMNWTPAAIGTYAIRARATDNNGVYTDRTATISVNQFFPPVVNFTQPLNGQFVSGGQPFTMTANASDPDGTVQRVEFYVGNTLVFTDFTPPYTTTWVPATAGAYNLIARAWDNQGLTSRDSIRVTVGNFAPPTVQFLNPTNGAQMPVGGQVQVNVHAFDVDGAVQEVRFFQGNTLLATKTAPPYTFTWTPTAVGAYNLIARARDVQGLWGRDSIRVFSQPQQPPVVNFTQPLNGQFVSGGQPFTMTANASDPDGTVQRVEFFVGNTLVFTDFTPPYTTTWVPAIAGAYNLIARAWDNQGLTSRDSIRVTVGNFAPPTVQFLFPLNGNSVTVGQAITVQVNATDIDGAVQEVRFFQGNTLLQTKTAPPYTFNWTPPTTGAYNLIARALDVQGLWGRDSIRVFSVTSFAPPAETEGVFSAGPSPLSIFPNPTNRFARLVLPEEALDGGLASLAWYSMEGKEIERRSVELVPGERELPVDLESLPAGSYLLTFDHLGRRYVGRMVKTN